MCVYRSSLDSCRQSSSEIDVDVDLYVGVKVEVFEKRKSWTPPSTIFVVAASRRSRRSRPNYIFTIPYILIYSYLEVSINTWMSYRYSHRGSYYGWYRIVELVGQFN